MGLHVIHSGSRWAVRKAGAARASAVLATQQKATNRAKELARAKGQTVYIFGKDGRIQRRIT